MPKRESDSMDPNQVLMPIVLHRAGVPFWRGCPSSGETGVLSVFRQACGVGRNLRIRSLRLVLACDLVRHLRMLAQFLANFSLFTNCSELRRVLQVLSQPIDNGPDVRLTATRDDRSKHRRFRLIIAWLQVQILLGPPYLRKLPKVSVPFFRSEAEKYESFVFVGFAFV